MDLHVYPQFRDQSPGPNANQMAVSAFHAPQGTFLEVPSAIAASQAPSFPCFPAMASPPVDTPWPPCPLPELPVPASARLWQRVPKPGVRRKSLAAAIRSIHHWKARPSAVQRPSIPLFRKNNDSILDRPTLFSSPTHPSHHPLPGTHYPQSNICRLPSAYRCLLSSFRRCLCRPRNEVAVRMRSAP